MRRKPDFFIIGAPKCGTTALAEYLRTHPRVFFCDPKEPNFFNEDFAGRATRSLERYLGYFAGATQRHLVLGEGTVWYLRSAVAVDRIMAFNPDARFLVMLRSPLDMAPSCHSQAVYNAEEDEPDFERAWRLTHERRSGRRLPAGCRDVKIILYDELCRLGDQVERLLRSVPAGQVKLLRFDEFVRETERIYAEVLSFLGLPSDARTSFPRVNPNKRPRSLALNHIVQVSGRVKDRLGLRRGAGVLGYLNRVNIRQESRSPMSPSLRAELSESFRDDVAKLSGLIRADLSSWLDPITAPENRPPGG